MHKYILCFLAVVVVVTGFSLTSGRAAVYTDKEVESVTKKVVASPVYGEIKKGTRLFEDTNEKSAYSLSDKRESVLILRDFSLKWYLVKRGDDELWIRAEDISIPEDEPTAKDPLTDREIECFVNTRGFESDTDKFVWVDIHRQQVYILKGRQGSFRLEMRIECATGKNQSPTTRGLFTVSDRGEWFYSTRLKSGAKFWVRFNGSYLFHSVAMDKEGNVTDSVLGERRSSGCVRMSVDDAEYMYKSVKEKTAVWVN